MKGLGGPDFNSQLVECHSMTSGRPESSVLVFQHVELSMDVFPMSFPSPMRVPFLPSPMDDSFSQQHSGPPWVIMGESNAQLRANRCHATWKGGKGELKRSRHKLK